MTRHLVNGVHFNVEMVGDGRPLILLHGFTGSCATWEPFFTPFGAHRTVVAIDLLGHGHSDSPADSRRYRIEHCLDDLTALFQHLGIGEYDLLGYSMGGRVAIHLALAHGDRVGRLILESASPGVHGPQERVTRIHADAELAGVLDRSGLEAFIDRWESAPLFATQTRLPAPVRSRLRAQRLAGNAVGLAGSLRGFGAGVPEPLFRRAHALRSTLLIAGELDEKYARLARLMGGIIPDAQVTIVPDVGHAVHLERPDTFEAIVLEFLGVASVGASVQ